MTKIKFKLSDSDKDKTLISLGSQGSVKRKKEKQMTFFSFKGFHKFFTIEFIPIVGPQGQVYLKGFLLYGTRHHVLLSFLQVQASFSCECCSLSSVCLQTSCTENKKKIIREISSNAARLILYAYLFIKCYYNFFL